jgi:hypothetical protein
MKKLVIVLITGILIGWSTEYAYLRYQAAQAEKAVIAFFEQMERANIKLPAP